MNRTPTKNVAIELCRPVRLPGGRRRKHERIGPKVRNCFGRVEKKRIVPPCKEGGRLQGAVDRLDARTGFRDPDRRTKMFDECTG